MQEMATHIDLAQKIVHEVKSQGVFDEFRKDSIADVDTKPAYLNLRQRVENAVHTFLAEQKWTPDTNKYQLREKLRRHISESGFLDVGVERIVDQVVNPKIGSVFQPRIEEIAYKYLGLPPPVQTKRELSAPTMALPPFPLNGNALKIETLQEESENLLPKDLEQISPESDKTAVKEDDTCDGTIDDDKTEDEDESPPFEPLTECKSPIKSEADIPNIVKSEIKTELLDQKSENKTAIKQELEDLVAAKEVPTQAQVNSPKEQISSVDALASQESQLSQVSSDSQISSISINQLNQSVSNVPTNSENAAAANLSEEAQMPKFNENSTDVEGNSKNISDLHFDIKKDEIKFEGTERKVNRLDGEQTENIKDAATMKEAYTSDSIEAKGAFHFTKLNVEVETCNITQEALSSVSSQDDTSSAQLCIVEKSEQKLVQADTNSTQKISQEGSNAALNNSQTKPNDEKQKQTSSSSFSRYKKSSSSKDKYRHSPEKSRRHDDKDQRERSKHSDRHGEGKYSAKVSSSNKHYSSSERHSSSSKRDEKSSHRSPSSRSESRSRHSSSKKDHRHDSKKHRSSSSHKISRSENHKSSSVAPNDDHNEPKDKLRWRKSTDSNDDDKSPSARKAANGTAYVKSNTETTTTSTTGKTKSTNHESNKHSKGTRESDATNNIPDNEQDETTLQINKSNVVIVNEILENPSTGFIDIGQNIVIKSITTEQLAITDEEETDLLYFEQIQNPIKIRLSLLNDAIFRCNDCLKATMNNSLQQRTDSAVYDELMAEINITNNNNNEIDLKQKTKATLKVDCFRYQSELDSEATSAKRYKFNSSADSGMSKENQMNEKNAIKTEIGVKKATSSKRVDLIAKQQQQRYTSEDLYKPRPVLGQRSKRRGFDALT